VTGELLLASLLGIPAFGGALLALNTLVVNPTKVLRMMKTTLRSSTAK